MIIGVAKAGSTSLYNYLKQHPEIFMSPVKEPRYFSPEYYTTYYKKAGRGNIYHEGMSLRTYQSLFEDVHKEIAIGEASTEYMFFEKTPKRISVTIPHAKIISILRNPVDRACCAHCIISVTLVVTLVPWGFEIRRKKEYVNIGKLAGFTKQAGFIMNN